MYRRPRERPRGGASQPRNPQQSPTSITRESHLHDDSVSWNTRDSLASQGLLVVPTSVLTRGRLSNPDEYLPFAVPMSRSPKILLRQLDVGCSKRFQSSLPL